MASTAFPVESLGTARPPLFLAIFCAWLLLNVLLLVVHSSPSFSGGFSGADSYMRVLRVTELLQTGAWHDSVIERSNAPYGDVLHWTRPFDVLIALLALPLWIFLGLKAAVFWAATLITPLLQLASAFAFAWAAGPLLHRPTRMLAAIALLLQPAALNYLQLGRADHHGLLLLLFVLLFGFGIRMMLDSRPRSSAVTAGVLAALALWSSIELILVLLTLLGAMTVFWLLRTPGRARQGFWFSLAFLVTICLALLCERGFGGFWVVEYDRLSIVHLVIAGLISGFWTMAWLVQHTSPDPQPVFMRILLLATWIVLALIWLNFIFPGFFQDPMGPVDPMLKPIWLDKVTEMRAVLPISTAGLSEFILFLGLSLIALPSLIWFITKESEGPLWPAWCLIAIGAFGYTLVAALHVRFSLYAEALYILPTAAVLQRLLTRSEALATLFSRVLVKAFALSLLMVGPAFAGKGLERLTAPQQSGAKDASISEGIPGCDLVGLSSFLDNAPAFAGEPLIILGFLDFGPELLYRTRHSVVATPYHRNSQGIGDSYRALTTEDEALSERLLRRRGVDIVLLCPTATERNFFGASPGPESARLYDRLARADGPAWLEPIILPEDLSGESFRLYRVLP